MITPKDEFEFRLDAKITHITDKKILDSLRDLHNGATFVPSPQENMIDGKIKFAIRGPFRIGSGAGAEHSH
jgi:hypothetical protein